MKYFGFGVVVVGALIVYLSKLIVKKIKKSEDSEEVSDKDNLYCKLLGTVIVLAGIILVFL